MRQNGQNIPTCLNGKFMNGWDQLTSFAWSIRQNTLARARKSALRYKAPQTLTIRHHSFQLKDIRDMFTVNGNMNLGFLLVNVFLVHVSGHSKVCHLTRFLFSNQDVTSGEIAMDDLLIQTESLSMWMKFEKTILNLETCII